MIADSSHPYFTESAESLRQQSEQRYRSLVAATSSITRTTDPQGRIVEQCPAWEAFTGQSFAQYRDLGWADAIHPEDRDHVRTVWEKAVASRERYAVEYRLRHRDGTWRHVRVRGVPVLDERGEVREWVCACTDITDQMKAADELRRAQKQLARQLEVTNGIADSLADSELRLRLAMDAGGMGTWEWPIGSSTFEWSPALEELHGHRPTSCDPTFAAFLADVDPQDRPAVEQVILQTRTRRIEHHVEYRVRLPDGTTRWIEARGKLFTDASGKPQRMIGVCTDVTQRKWAEETLRRSNEELERIVGERTEELQSLNQQLRTTNRELEDFASVASHDLQEPLRKIQAFGSRLDQRAGAGLDAESRDYLDRMLRAAGRMQRLITDLLQFSRVTTGAQPFVQVDLNNILAGVLSDLETRIEQTGGRVEHSTLPTLDADPVQMQQLLLNLIGNGLKFHRREVPPVVRVTVGPEPAEGVCAISVQDNGIGFEEKYLDRIFNVFQRLHPRTEYEGTGIGLAVCRKIVERHGGSISARSQPNVGSTFVFTLPMRHGSPERAND